MKNKRADTLVDAVANVKDGDTVLLGGFGGTAMPEFLVDGVCDRGVRGLTVVSNNAGWTARTPDQRKPGRELGFTAFHEMAESLGGYGEQVEDPAEIKPALDRAFSSGKAAVVNVIVEPTAGASSAAWRGARME